MRDSTVVGRGLVPWIHATGAHFAISLQVGRCFEWDIVLGPSLVDDSVHSSDGIRLDMEHLVCKEWKSAYDDPNSCHVEFQNLFGKLVGIVRADLTLENRDTLMKADWKLHGAKSHSIGHGHGHGSVTHLDTNIRIALGEAGYLDWPL